MAVDHTPETCPGLAELREGLSSTRQLWLAQREWLKGQFTGVRREVEAHLRGLRATVEDIRRQSIAGDREIADTRRHNGTKYEKRWEGVFARLNRLERHLAVQWVLMLGLSLLTLGKGAAWLWGLIAPLISGGAP